MGKSPGQPISSNVCALHAICFHIFHHMRVRTHLRVLIYLQDFFFGWGSAIKWVRTRTITTKKKEKKNTNNNERTYRVSLNYTKYTIGSTWASERWKLCAILSRRMCARARKRFICCCVYVRSVHFFSLSFLMFWFMLCNCLSRLAAGQAVGVLLVWLDADTRSNRFKFKFSTLFNCRLDVQNGKSKKSV